MRTRLSDINDITFNVEPLKEKISKINYLSMKQLIASLVSFIFGLMNVVLIIYLFISDTVSM